MSWTVNSIGVVRSPISEAMDENWGGVESDIELFSPYDRGLKGLEEFLSSVGGVLASPDRLSS